MRCRTSLNANQARLKRGKEPQYVGSSQPLTNDNRAIVVDTVNLKDILCDIEADPDRGHGDLPLNNNAVPPILSEPGSAVAEGVHPVPSAASGKQKSYASQAGPPVGSDQASTSCLEHHDGTCAPTGGHDGCPVGSRATERQYRDRQASWRPVRIGEDRMVEETIAWFAGVDWGSAKHQACLLGVQGTIVGEREFPHSGKGLSELADWILSMTDIASAVAVAVEVPHGPVVDVLLDRGFIVHAINPKQLDRLRDRFSIAGAKDDRRDAYVSADGLRTDRHLFRRLQIADPRLIELRAWSRLAEELQEERVRLSNRLHQQLWRYYPQMLKLSDDLTATWFLELWLRAPSPAKAARLRVSAVERLLKQHRIRRVSAEGILRTLREPAIKVPDGVAAAAGVHIRSLIVRLQVVNRELDDAERKLDELCTAIGETAAASEERAEHRDVAILRSLPGIGRINLATLLSEASGPLCRRDYQALRTLSGVAPVTKRSGKSHVVVMRYASHVRLRNTVYHWARVATQHDHESRTRYAALRRRGHSHGRAIRGVADRLLAVACVLLQRQTLFDPHFRQAAS